MPRPRTRQRLLAAVALAGSGLVVGALGFVTPASASEPRLSAGATVQVADLAALNTQASFRFGETPPPSETPPSDPPPSDPPPSDPPPSDPPEDPPCDITQDPTCGGEEEPGEETPPGIPPDLPPGGGDPDPPSDPPNPPQPGPDVEAPPNPGPGPDGGGSDDCADGGLDCAPEGSTDSQQGRAIPETQPAANQELADTGATGLMVVGLLGAALVAVGGFLAIRRYRGSHRA